MAKRFIVPTPGVKGLEARIPEAYKPIPLYALFQVNGNSVKRVSFQAYLLPYALAMWSGKIISEPEVYSLRAVDDSKGANLTFGKGCSNGRPKVIVEGLDVHQQH